MFSGQLTNCGQLEIPLKNMAHIAHQHVSAKLMKELKYEMNARGRNAEVIRANAKETLTYILGATISYRKKSKMLVIQGKSETVHETNRLFIECQTQQWKHEQMQKQDEKGADREQLSQRRQEVSELIVYIMEWTSKHTTKERRTRTRRRAELRIIRGDQMEPQTTSDEECEETLISEFKGALLKQICSKMPQSIL